MERGGIIRGNLWNLHILAASIAGNKEVRGFIAGLGLVASL